MYKQDFTFRKCEIPVLLCIKVSHCNAFFNIRIIQQFILIFLICFFTFSFLTAFSIVISTLSLFFNFVFSLRIFLTSLAHCVICSHIILIQDMTKFLQLLGQL